MTSMIGNGGTQTGFREKVPKGYKAGTMQQFTPEQMKLFGQLFSTVSPGSYLSRLSEGDEEAFKRIEGPALRQFNELQGGLASRFSGMGMGARQSSGFQNMATAAGSEFAQDLAARRRDLQRQAILDMMGLSESLLGQRPQERFLIQKQHKPSFWQSLLGLGSSAAQGAGMAFGGPLGGAAAKGFSSLLGL